MSRTTFTAQSNTMADDPTSDHSSDEECRQGPSSQGAGYSTNKPYDGKGLLPVPSMRDGRTGPGGWAMARALPEPHRTRMLEYLREEEKAANERDAAKLDAKLARAMAEKANLEPKK